MITSLFSFSSLIQFIGAFNFANIYRPFHDAIFKYFLDINYRFNKKFDAINDQIITDEESLNRVTPICTRDGKSNQQYIDSLKEKYKKLEIKKEEKIKYLNNKIDKHYKPQYINSLFLLTGLYSIFDLFLLALMDGTKYCYNICLYSSIFNLLSAIYVGYFILCEVIFFFRWDGNIHKIFRPTHLMTSIAAVLLVLLALLIYYINIWIVNKLGYNIGMYNSEDLYFFLYLSIIIPFSSFTTSIVCVIILYRLSTKCIEAKSKALIDEYNKLHKEKITLDETYNQFSGISFG